MNTLPIIATAAFALLAAPALAQDHAAHHPEGAAPAAKSMDMAKMSPEEMHKHCAMVMGGKMRGTPKHDHSADKLGHAPAMKAPTEAEMKSMHNKCAAMMADEKVAPSPDKK